jgi:hypothetical protein
MIAVSLRSGEIWHPPDASSQMLRTSSKRLDGLERFVEAALASKSDHGLSSLLPILLRSPHATSVPKEAEHVLAKVLHVRKALKGRNLTQFVNVIDQLLGLGRGLTPSGDDLVTGLLLVLNRWPSIHALGDKLQNVNDWVVKAARKKTTMLSANLIECATIGQSDERLMSAIDCIVTGKPQESECVPALLGWGASSGVDALAGVAIALTT